MICGVLDPFSRLTRVPFDFATDQVLIMPGSILTVMTGGGIPPLYHQARNLGIHSRKSVMYFASLDPSGPIGPFVVNEANREVDIRQLVTDNPQSVCGRAAEDFVSTDEQPAGEPSPWQLPDRPIASNQRVRGSSS